LHNNEDCGISSSHLFFFKDLIFLNNVFAVLNKFLKIKKIMSLCTKFVKAFHSKKRDEPTAFLHLARTWVPCGKKQKGTGSGGAVLW
jgi:hypothetical protein